MRQEAFVVFHSSFSRQDTAQTRLALFFWLNEKVLPSKIIQQIPYMRRIIEIALSVFLFAIGMQEGFAQPKLKFWVTSFEIDQFDMTAKNEAYKKIDGNGSLYAIIKVTSSTPEDDLKAYNFNFGNMNSKLEMHDGELWVYVQRNAKMVTIRREGYETVNRYDLKTTIEAGRTYTMQLATQTPTVYTQMALFKVRPAGIGATVVVQSAKGKESLGLVDETGSVARSLEYGTYTYEVIAPNYHPSEGRFTLNDKTVTHTEEVVLRPNFSEVTLKVDADADIYVNGEKKGHRTWTGILKAGNYQVECRQENHRNISQYIAVSENDNRTFDLQKPIPITGTLAVTTRPLGASIRIDGKDYGTTPQNINDLLIGPHTVTLTKTNYKTESQRVEIKESQTATLDVTLNDIARMTIQSEPANATLYIDGKRVGSTPYSAEMPSGDYDIRVTRHKYHDYRKTIHLDSSNPLTTLSLKRQYQNPNAFYIQAGVQAGSLLAAEGTVGAYIRNINFEVSYLYGLDESETIYWNYMGTSNSRPESSVYEATAVGGKVGYGFIVGTRCRFTPQAGVTVVSVDSDSHVNGGYSVGVQMGARFDVSVFRILGLFVAPEYGIPVKQSEVYEQLRDVSTSIKSWSEGFNVRAGVSITF